MRPTATGFTLAVLAAVALFVPAILHQAGAPLALVLLMAGLIVYASVLLASFARNGRGHLQRTFLVDEITRDYVGDVLRSGDIHNPGTEVVGRLAAANDLRRLHGLPLLAGSGPIRRAG